MVLIVLSSSAYYLFVSGINTISTDKKVYSSGEEVKIHWRDFRIQDRCCGGRDIGLFRQEGAEWVAVKYYLNDFACFNGKLNGGLGFPVMVSCVCSPPRLILKQGNFSWNSTAYEANGTVDSCLKSSYGNESINQTMTKYDLKNASPGKYKFVLGNAEAIIEIK